MRKELWSNEELDSGKQIRRWTDSCFENLWFPETGPRTTVPFNEDHIRQFSEPRIQNYSTMLVLAAQRLLLVGAREAVFALDLGDISKKKGSVYWNVTDTDEVDCTNKGKQADTECQNYIRILQEMSDGRVYVCGTNAFSPACKYMRYADGKLILEKDQEDGKGKCPFDPFQRYTSVMVEGSLYSATSNNFLGSEPVVMRSLSNPVRTEFKITLLNEPSFISMHYVPEGLNSPTEDDDKVYLFFSETALEYDFYSKLTVSRVARVCKEDMGGLRTLQKKWTSFLKARIDCPGLDSRLPLLVQDVFLLKQDNWRESIFYAVFTPQQNPVDHSSVCAYKVSDIGKVFSEGKFKTPVTVANSFVKWVMYSEDLPEPRPGACIDKAARDLGVKNSLELPDKTLRFVQDRPLMDLAVVPMDKRPQLVEKGAVFTRIVVHQVEALDGKSYNVMFMGTENGYLHKAVNYDGEMVVIEEVQLFETPEPVKILRLSSSEGLLYAGSDSGVVQVSLSECGRHASCQDCVLARDPYCAWDTPASRCISLPGRDPPKGSSLIQSLIDGDASRCSDSDPNLVKVNNITLVPGSNIKLPCQPYSNLARVKWHLLSQPLQSDRKYDISKEGLMILDATPSDAGLYTCRSEETVKGRLYTREEAKYRVVHKKGRMIEKTPQLEAQTQGASLTALQVSVVVLSILLGALLAWNLYRGHLPLPCRSRKSQDRPMSNQRGPQVASPASDQVRNCLEDKPLMTEVNYSANNNRLNGDSALSPKATMDAFKYIDDESEI
ncbi:hypothetical protein GJAV_G00122810 [Gymnothorax javanicus]|nr:hypothetical protein GJAV_G00122810 [Gymnothorax javanicus]